jgi:bifunctional N-acetylglucosamine-1-phosphate-uridyltransferase/glucosamine-1-phosphate-acetyltransferase GlmU-like protein
MCTEHSVVIVPAAGYGRRMGQPPAKELLPHPQTGRPLIGEALDRIAGQNLRAHVIVRDDKTALLDYLANRKTITVQTVKPTAEWPHTVLQSEASWAQHNLLYLPDTDFAPLDIMPRLLAAPTATAWAVHRVPDPEHWGMLKLSQGDLHVAEKPQDGSGDWAWGMVAFQRSAGRNLFEAMIASGEATGAWQKLRFSFRLIELESFRDLTR